VGSVAGAASPSIGGSGQRLQDFVADMTDELVAIMRIAIAEQREPARPFTVPVFRQDRSGGEWGDTVAAPAARLDAQRPARLQRTVRDVEGGFALAGLARIELVRQQEDAEIRLLEHRIRCVLEARHGRGNALAVEEQPDLDPAMPRGRQGAEKPIQFVDQMVDRLLDLLALPAMRDRDDVFRDA
jgi:hypothetical protein